MSHEPSFGDFVRIARTPETEERRFAGREGQVFGESIPSRSGVGPVIGDRGEDYAVSVFFEEAGEQIWFGPHLVEFVRYVEEEPATAQPDPLDRVLDLRERLPFAVPDPDGELKRRLEDSRDDAK